MKTLYDLLGALPKDDAEELRTAFRKAAKGAHPDLHPGDPDAALKFREIVRASEILGDTEQRAAYDHLLELAHLEQVSASQHATAARFRAPLRGDGRCGCLDHDGGKLSAVHANVGGIARASGQHPRRRSRIGICEPSTTGKTLPAVNEEPSGIPREDVEPSVILPPVNTKTLPPAKQAQRPSRARPASTTTGTPRVVPASITNPPLPRPRPSTNDPSREESVASVRLR